MLAGLRPAITDQLAEPIAAAADGISTVGGVVTERATTVGARITRSHYNGLYSIILLVVITDR